MNQTMMDTLEEFLNDALTIIDHRYAPIVRSMNNQINRELIFTDNQLVEHLQDVQNAQLQMNALVYLCRQTPEKKADMLSFILQALTRDLEGQVKVSYMALLSIQMRKLKNQWLWPQFQDLCLEQLQGPSEMFTAFSLICLCNGWKYVEKKPACYLKIDFDTYFNAHWPPQIQSKFILAALQYTTRFGEPAQLQRELKFALQIVSTTPVSQTINSLMDVLTQFAGKLSQQFFRQLQLCPLIMEFKNFQPESLRRLWCFMLKMVEIKSQNTHQIAFALLHELNHKTQFIVEDYQMEEYTIEALHNLANSKQNCEKLFKYKNIFDRIFGEFSQNQILLDFLVCKLCGKLLKFWPSQILLQYFQEWRIIKKIYMLVKSYLVSYKDRPLYFVDQAIRTLRATLGFEILWRPDVQRLALLISIDVAIKDIKSGIQLEAKRQNQLNEVQTANKEVISMRFKEFQELGKQSKQILSIVRQADLQLQKQRLLGQQVQPKFLFPSLILDQRENNWICYFLSVAFQKSIRNPQLLLTSKNLSQSFQAQIAKASPLVLLMRTENSIIACIAVTTEAGKDQKAFFCFLDKEQFFRLRHGKKAILLDKDNINFGNQDVLITRNSHEIKTTFGTKDSSFSLDSHLRKELGASHPQRTVKFISYEFFTVSLA